MFLEESEIDKKEDVMFPKKEGEWKCGQCGETLSGNQSDETFPQLNTTPPLCTKCNIPMKFYPSVHKGPHSSDQLIHR